MVQIIETRGLGGTGGGAGFIVPDSANIPFADTAARDAWAAANLSDLIENQTIVSVTGSPDNTWYLWRGDTNPPSHDNSNWIDATPLVQGEDGVAGADGSDGQGVDFTGFNDGDLMLFRSATSTTAPAALRQDMASGEIVAEARTIFNPSINLGDVALLSTAGILRLENGNDIFAPIGVPIIDNGTGAPLCPTFGAPGELPANIQQPNQSETLTLTPGESMSYSFTIPAGIDHIVTAIDIIAVANGNVRLQIFDGPSAVPSRQGLDERSAVTAGTHRINYSGWARYQTGMTILLLYTNTGSADLTLRGVTIGSDFVPTNTLFGRTYSLDLLQNKLNIGPMPPTTTAITGFSIDIPERVDLNTNLNAQHTITFTTSNTSDISSLTLVNSGGDDITVTVPDADGTHTAQVTLTGVDTSSDQMISFSLQAATLTSGTVNSNVDVVNVRNVPPQEFAYHGTRSTNDFDTVTVSTLTSSNVTNRGTSFRVNHAVSDTYFLGILVPSNRDLVTLTNNALSGAPELDNFTRTENVRTIGGIQYHLYTEQNNAGDEVTLDLQAVTA